MYAVFTFGVGDEASEISYVFFFQAEDGIRDYKVTGVQTCALPIWRDRAGLPLQHRRPAGDGAREPRAPRERGDARRGDRRRRSREVRRVVPVARREDRKSVV